MLPEVRREAERRKIKLLAVPTARAIEELRQDGPGTDAKKIASGGNGSILVRSREGKMEIPAENSFFFIGKSLSPCGAQFWPKTNIPRGLKSPGPVNSVVTIATINKTWLLDRSPRPRLIGY